MRENSFTHLFREKIKLPYRFGQRVHYFDKYVHSTDSLSPSALTTTSTPPRPCITPSGASTFPCIAFPSDTTLESLRHYPPKTPTLHSITPLFSKHVRFSFIFYSLHVDRFAFQGGKLEEALEKYKISEKYGVERAAMHIRNVNISSFCFSFPLLTLNSRSAQKFSGNACKKRRQRSPPRSSHPISYLRKCTDSRSALFNTVGAP